MDTDRRGFFYFHRRMKVKGQLIIVKLVIKVMEGQLNRVRTQDVRAARGPAPEFELMLASLVGK